MSPHIMKCPNCHRIIDFEWEGDQPVERVVCGSCTMPFNIEAAENYFRMIESGAKFSDEEFEDYFNVQFPTKTYKNNDFLSRVLRSLMEGLGIS